MKMDTWTIIPAHNEEKNIAAVIKKTKKYCKNIVVVDDGSSDSTYNEAKKQNVVVLRHIVNLGKGAALKTGCDYAFSKKAGILIAMDADGQHDPKDMPRFVRGLKDNDIVFSYRKIYRKIPAVLRFGNWFINETVKILHGIKLRDTQCGYRAFKSGIYKKIRWVSQDYSVESEIIVNVGKHNLKYTEIPIQTIYSDKYKGTSVIDGIRIVMSMLWWKVTATYWGLIKK